MELGNSLEQIIVLRIYNNNLSILLPKPRTLPSVSVGASLHFRSPLTPYVILTARQHIRAMIRIPSVLEHDLTNFSVGRLGLYGWNTQRMNASFCESLLGNQKKQKKKILLNKLDFQTHPISYAT
ncbi:hypothetical protein F4827_007000 [Paraburkholderia bannensis]|uniref:Uncharacterized protein n=1 Tax=Paraburkholderia bannensis TaxID=765414 RepID=A0A7W9U509_9BURK|nr:MULTISPECIES: hypothetical protein [Paraburkholderia]MBB3262120.1 hypothetical protein [Paraburkholderia sp. WP4_3_2]MBB6107119.1 hypothetical protein [Paraburkholderia bannensis]